MGKLTTKIDYENLRIVRILENQAILESLGLHKTISDLQSVASSTKPVKKKYCKRVCGITPLRRSDRLKSVTTSITPNRVLLTNHVSLRRSSRLSGKPSDPTLSKADVDEEDEEESYSSEVEEKRPANAPLVRIKGGFGHHQLSPEASARRCLSQGRGSVYDPVFGICCHFCRQKKLCGEEDCKRCGNLDMDQPCIGKTDCSVCHSSNGVLCRACLKVRYGEELEEVRQNKEWMCPHCIEETGIKPYWICNSSLCLTKRKMAPTGLAIYRALEMGYKSVAHLLMDELQQADKRRR